MKLYKDPVYNFIEIFNEKNGLLIRSNILDNQGNETKKEPLIRSFPELIDIGIMGRCHVNQIYCKKFGVDCYQANNVYDDMSYEDYKMIINQCKNRTFQVALGGRGDPNKHKNFAEILEYTYNNGIVPNLTTSGIDMSDVEIELMKKYCGAVAISMYSKVINDNGKFSESNPKTIEAINKLINANIITNIHYVISNDTIDDIIVRLERNIFPNQINAIIFLLYKPVGNAKEEKIININDKKFKKFMEILNSKKFNFKIGFDTCFSPIIISSLKDVNAKTIDFCEAAKFSCYISPNMIMYPCSFIQKKEYGVDLKMTTIQNAWCSTKFKEFKNNNKYNFIGSCPCGLNSKACCKNNCVIYN